MRRTQFMRTPLECRVQLPPFLRMNYKLSVVCACCRLSCTALAVQFRLCRSVSIAHWNFQQSPGHVPLNEIKLFFPLLSGVRQLGLEPEQYASAGAVGAHPHQCGHLGYEGTLALCRHVFLLILLAHRGPLELLNQFPALVRLQRMLKTLLQITLDTISALAK